MSKVDEDVPYIVEPKDYDPELEKEVRAYFEEAVPLPSTKKYHARTEPPKTNNIYEQELWEREEVRRCREGHNGLVGKMYFYYNYGWIQKIEGGRIRPEFRTVDHEWFKLVTEVQESKGWGIVCIKRRRVGASWKEAADTLHDIIFNSHYHVGMNSKSEVDSKELFAKVHFMFDHLASFLRPRVTKTKQDHLNFGIKFTDKDGNTRMKGHQSYIAAKAPTSSAFEGYMLNKWICDEAGKIDNLLQMFAFTEDTMMDEYRRTGTPIIFGTVGEVDGKGGGIFELWENSDAYKLKKFFFKGWMGLFVDSMGNDQIEESIRYIVYERINQAKRGKKAYNDFLQRYPLNEEDAFAIAIDGGLGDPAKLNEQRASLRTNPIVEHRGWYDWDQFLKTGEPVFKPNKTGLVRMFERPQPLVDAYAVGVDPVEAVESPLPGASMLSFIMRRKPIGLQPGATVMEITYRPEDVERFYEQAICALVDYNTRALIERNRYDMISWFNRNGFKHLILPSPMGMHRIVGGRPTTMGVSMTKEVKKYMEGLIIADLEHNTDKIPTVELCRELLVYGSRNTDRVMAYGLALMQEAEMTLPARAAGQGTNAFQGMDLVWDGERLRRTKSFRKTLKEQVPQGTQKRGPGNYVV